MSGTSPPGPHRCGSTTWRVKAVARPASKALPPRSSTPMPTAEPIQCVEATTPKVPSISGRVVKRLGSMKLMARAPVGAGVGGRLARGTRAPQSQKDRASPGLRHSRISERRGFASPRLRGEGSAFGRTSGAKRSGGEGAVLKEAPFHNAAPSSTPPPHPRLLRRLAAFGGPLPASGERRIRGLRGDVCIR